MQIINIGLRLRFQQYCRIHEFSVAVRKDAFRYSKVNTNEHPWRNIGIDGIDEFSMFLKIHFLLTLRKPEGLSKGQAERLNRNLLKSFMVC